MNSEKISSTALTAWIFAAIVPTTIQLTSGTPWTAMLPAVIICLFCVGLRWKWGTNPPGKAYALISILLLVLLLGVLLQNTADCWPQSKRKTIPLILLALALWSARKGTKAAASVGCLLFWFLLIMYLILLGAGVPSVQAKWLRPELGDISALGCILLLTPAVAAVHLPEKQSMKPRLILCGIVCIAATVVTSGVLSLPVAQTQPYPFYQMTRHLTLFGKARRFEAVLSAGTAVGWFALLSLYLTSMQAMGEQIAEGWGKKSAILGAITSAVYLLTGWKLPPIIMLISAALFWVLLPLGYTGISKIKKSKKSEKRA